MIKRKGENMKVIEAFGKMMVALGILALVLYGFFRITGNWGWKILIIIIAIEGLVGIASDTKTIIKQHKELREKDETIKNNSVVIKEQQLEINGTKSRCLAYEKEIQRLKEKYRMMPLWEHEKAAQLQEIAKLAEKIKEKDREISRMAKELQDLRQEKDPLVTAFDEIGEPMFVPKSVAEKMGFVETERNKTRKETRYCVENENGEPIWVPASALDRVRKNGGQELDPERRERIKKAVMEKIYGENSETGE